jgi:DNA-binding beta-propeller fold protein YncE
MFAYAYQYSKGDVTTLAGSGTAGLVNGEASGARFNFPRGVAVHPVTGDVYVSESHNNRIRKISQGELCVCARRAVGFVCARGDRRALCMCEERVSFAHVRGEQ